MAAVAASRVMAGVPGVNPVGMSDVTHRLEPAVAGDRSATADLFPLVYDELRKLPAVRMTAETPGDTPQPIALIHEAYLRLVSAAGESCWDGHTPFLAAEAKRRILVDAARYKKRSLKGGETAGGRRWPN